MQRRESIFLFLSAPKSSELITEVKDNRVIFPNRHIEQGDSVQLSPGGQWLLYSQFDEEGSDIMLVDHFR